MVISVSIIKYLVMRKKLTTQVMGSSESICGPIPVA